MSATGSTHGSWFLNNHVSIGPEEGGRAERISLVEMRMPFDEAPPLHVHHVEDEVFYVLDGVIRFRVGEEERTVARGETLLAPKGRLHGFRVLSEDGARVLIVTDGGFERMVRTMSRPARAPALPEPTAPTPALRAALAAECARHAIEILGPPIA